MLSNWYGSLKIAATRAVIRRPEGLKDQKIRSETRLGKNQEGIALRRLLIVLKIIRTELISKYQDHPLVDHFGIKKI